MSKKSYKDSTSITAISVKGFKSFKEECKINIRPLTILAGSNSSGKSSIFQPILMMKQTLNEVFDPGALQMNGANVKFTQSEQLITKDCNINEFSVELQNGVGKRIGITYEKRGGKAGFDIRNMKVITKDTNVIVSTEVKPSDEILNNLLKTLPDFFKDLLSRDEFKPAHRIIRNRCFLEFSIYDSESKVDFVSRSFAGKMQIDISEMLHLPGLRGNPERNYPLTGVDFEEMNFTGTFEKYVASIIANWIDTKNTKLLNKLKTYLKKLNLANNIKTQYINDTEIALYVSRFNKSKDEDVVSIADVGLGVSQTLPILVALLIAKKGQMVYIEQPEIHLHPRAQYELATIFSDAIKRGVVLIIETHSSVLLRGVQTEVVNEKIKTEDVALHWFLRDSKTGYSYVKSAELDNNGAFGEWPEDFDDTTMLAESRYLEAVEKRLFNV